MTYVYTATVEDRWPELKFRTMNVDLVTVFQAWLQTEESPYELLTQGCPFIGINRRDGIIG